MWCTMQSIVLVHFIFCFTPLRPTDVYPAPFASIQFGAVYKPGYGEEVVQRRSMDPVMPPDDSWKRNLPGIRYEGMTDDDKTLIEGMDKVILMESLEEEAEGRETMWSDLDKLKKHANYSIKTGRDFNFKVVKPKKETTKLKKSVGFNKHFKNKPDSTATYPPERMTNNKWTMNPELQSYEPKNVPLAEGYNEMSSSAALSAGKRSLMNMGRADNFLEENKKTRVEGRSKQNAKELIQNSCSEFAVDAVFEVRIIVDVDWIPFFIWSKKQRQLSVVHRFCIPNEKLIPELQARYAGSLGDEVDWNESKLILQGPADMLLIGTNKTGLFLAVKLIKNVMKINGTEMATNKAELSGMRWTTIQMKIVHPFLAMMQCESGDTVIMADRDLEPRTLEDKEKEAALLHFRGTGRPIGNIDLV